MLDLLVIGAGLAGLTAAIYAAQAGKSVRVITKGMNALHWAAGTIDLLGYLPDDSPVQQPLAALNQLDALHPLRQVDPADARQTLRDLQTWLADEGLPYLGAEDEANLWLPSAVGAKRPTYLAPTVQATARLDDPASLLVVGIDHFNDFYPAVMAENLRRQGHDARSHTLPIDLITPRRKVINEVYLAEALEADNLARVDAVAKALRDVVRPRDRVAFPAMLGVARHAEIVARLQSALDAPIAEIPTLPPSVPGLRLHHALARKLAKLGGRIESNMTAVDFGVAGREITWVATETTARPLRHHARACLLATGGILGGGINSDHNGSVWETVFNLPLVQPKQRAGWFRPAFLDPKGHPIFQAGVQVNAAWQPVDAAGDVVYGNLWAAGNVLANADSIRTRSHEAMALLTGAAAAHVLLPQRQPATATA